MVGVEQHDVGARACRERADRARQRLRSAGERAGEEPASGQFALLQRQHVARAPRAGAGRIPAAAALPRHRSGCWNRCRCRSGRPPRDSRAPSKMPSPSVASVSGQSPTTAPDAASARISCAVVWVAWITHQRGSSPALSRSHSTGRRPSAAMQSSTSFVCSAAWMWIGPSGAPRTRRAASRASRPAANAARCRHGRRAGWRRSRACARRSREIGRDH